VSRRSILSAGAGVIDKSPSPQRERSLLADARSVLLHESQVIASCASALDEHFCRAAEWLAACTGVAVVSGMGKAGLIGRKTAATLASLGMRSYFVHPAEALHGDAGAISADDVLLLFSNSGQSTEVHELLDAIAGGGQKTIAITGSAANGLARRSQLVIELGPIVEACPWGLVPSASTTAMLAVGDALALGAASLRGVGPDDFRRWHPRGALGAGRP
jgi:arabinose-5-phosphate isomerase